MYHDKMYPVSSPSVLQHKPFALFLCARAATFMAFQMLGVAVGWQIYAITGSALYLGLIGLVQFMPMFLLTLVVGHVADRYDRRRITRICQTVEGLAAWALALASFSGWQSKASILVSIFIIGATRAFEGPTMQALLPGLVPTELIPRAAAWSASATQTAVIIGPALGGFLYAAGPSAVYATAGILFLAASVFIALIRIERITSKHAHQHERYVTERVRSTTLVLMTRGTIPFAKSGGRLTWSVLTSSLPSFPVERTVMAAMALIITSMGCGNAGPF